MVTWCWCVGAASGRRSFEVSTEDGATGALHSGHVEWLWSQWRMQSMWKICLHAGTWSNSSFNSNSPKQTQHLYIFIYDQIATLYCVLLVFNFFMYMGISILKMVHCRTFLKVRKLTNLQIHYQFAYSWISIHDSMIFSSKKFSFKKILPEGFKEQSH